MAYQNNRIYCNSKNIIFFWIIIIFVLKIMNWQHVTDLPKSHCLESISLEIRKRVQNGQISERQKDGLTETNPEEKNPNSVYNGKGSYFFLEEAQIGSNYPISKYGEQKSTGIKMTKEPLIKNLGFPFIHVQNSYLQYLPITNGPRLLSKEPCSWKRSLLWLLGQTIQSEKWLT